MFHSHPLDWELVESHTVAPVQVVFKEDGPCHPQPQSFTTDVGEWTAGVKILHIAPNEISGSYTFDMHPSPRTSPPPSPRPKDAAAETGRPRPVSGSSTSTTASTDTKISSTKKLHRTSRASPASAKAISNPFTFGVLKRATPPATLPSKEEHVAVNVPEHKPERRRSFGATFSFLQPRHGRDRLGSTSSTSSTSSGESAVSTSGTEDGEGVSAGSKFVPATRMEEQGQAQAAPTHHSAGSHLPTVEPKLTPASNPATRVVVPPSPPAAAQPSDGKAQTKKVLKHARAELMKEVGKAGYNVLVVEGCVFHPPVHPVGSDTYGCFRLQMGTHRPPPR
jgi:hypothetical protein